MVRRLSARLKKLERAGRDKREKDEAQSQFVLNLLAKGMVAANPDIELVTEIDTDPATWRYTQEWLAMANHDWQRYEALKKLRKPVKTPDPPAELSKEAAATWKVQRLLLGTDDEKVYVEEAVAAARARVGREGARR